LVLAALAAAGCGSSSSSSSSAGGGPLNTELSYFPASSPAVALLATDPNGSAYQQATGFVARFPIAKLGLAALQSTMTKDGINYDQDIKPLLGNPVALGTPSASAASASQFLLVFIAKDASKLTALTKRQPAPQSAGSYDGAKLYQSGSYALAISGATAVLSQSLSGVKSALDLHAHGGGITAAAFTKAFTGLPQNTLLQVYGNLAGALATPSAAKALLVPWVGAIRYYAATVTVADTGITVRYRVDTTGATLTATQLPLPAGATAPSVSAAAPVAVGVKDLAHVIAFGEGAAQAINPHALAAAAKTAAKDGVNLNRDVFSQFSGDGEVDYGPGGVLARADLASPAAAARTLSKLKGLGPIGGGFYQSRSSGRRVRIGIVAGKLVLGSATAAQLRSFASATPTPIAGATGPVAFRVALGSLISLAMATRHSATPLNPGIQVVLSSFGDITGWAANDPSGFYGSFSLQLK
jgi:hypothetical protein